MAELCVRTEGEVKEKWSQLPDVYEARGLPSYYQLLGVATHGQFLAERSDPPRINPACRVVDLYGADGGGRTHTPVKTLDFESSASANSATSAF